MRGKNKAKAPMKTTKDNPCTSKKPKAEKSAVTCYTSNLGMIESSIPRPIGSELASIRFADTAEPSLITDILLYIPMSSHAMYQFVECIAVDAEGMNKTWLMPMFSDPAYFNGICFAVQSYLDQTLRRTRSAASQRTEYMHYAKTIALLQTRLASGDNETLLSESTLMTILCMLGHAYMTGDLEASNRHKSGLLKLVSLRPNGVASLLHRTRLCVEIIRCDLYGAIDAGTTPILFTCDNIPWPLLTRTVHTDPISMTRIQPAQVRTIKNLSPDLSVIWIAMFEFSSLINAASHKKGPKITEVQFLQSMTSILYRLLLQSFPKDSLNEAIRLSLIAFASPVFLHWNRTELLDSRFTFAYRDALSELDLETCGIEKEELVWLLTVAAVSMAHETYSMAWLNPWLKASLYECGIEEWAQLKELLNEFLWIELVFDSLGGLVFDAVMTGHSGHTASVHFLCDVTPEVM